MPEAWTVLKHAWSVRISIACVVLIWLEGPITTVVQFFAGSSFWSQMIAQGVISTMMVAAIYARVVAQDRLQARISREKRLSDGES